jgi:hypothetical protein
MSPRRWVLDRDLVRRAGESRCCFRTRSLACTRRFRAVDRIAFSCNIASRHAASRW